ncbi:MAG: B12-binding domain-containing radical SAM protein [Deltaproteobacteria bacterium]|nr:B12-binding domain-containing radical SAM protein [Deltaproteobacteria bacterium]
MKRFDSAHKEFRVLLVYPNLHMILVPSTAIALFTRILKKEGMEVGLFDTTHYQHGDTISVEKRVETLQARPFNPEKDISFKPLPADQLIPDFIKKVETFQPHLILVSVVEDTFKQAVRLMNAIDDKNIPTVMGGVFPTSAPEVALSFPSVKMIGIGEGETLVRSIATSLRAGKSIERIPNLWIKRPDGRILKNGLGSLIDLNKPWPDFSLFDEKRFLRPLGGRIFKTVPLESYRGCPFKCTFCNSPMQVNLSKENNLGNFLRRKKVSRLREEILYLIERHQLEYFYFVDDSFLSRPQQELDDFIKMYSEFKIPFWFNTRPESVSRERLRELKEVGLDRLSVGLECGNEEFRQKKLLRLPTNEKLLKHFEILAEGGVAFSINNIIGFPEETRELIFDTIEFNRKLKGFDTLTISIFTPYHGTFLRERAVQLGYLDPKTFTTHTTSSSLLNMPHLTSEQIDGIFRVFMMYVKFEKEFWPDIERAEKFDETGNEIFRELFKLYQERFYKTDQDGKPLRYALPPQMNSTTIKHPKGDHWEEVFGPMSKTQMR